MSVYVHKCQACPAKAVEATYPMSCVGAEEKLSVDLRRTISCNPVTCRHRHRRGKKYPVPVPPGPSKALVGLWPRVPQLPTIKGSAGGQTLTTKQLVARDKPKRQLRSKLHFKNDVLPTLGKREQRKFGRKWAHLKGDHEKIKI